MRNRDLISYFLSLVVLCSACAPKPEKNIPGTEVQVRVSPLPSSVKERLNTDEVAIWFVTSNFMTGGTLGRLDLAKGTIEAQVPGSTIPRDAVIVSDHSQGLFLLTRMGKDAVTYLKGPNARPSGHFRLPELINPQFAARDSLGRVWVTSIDSNHVRVLSNDLDHEVGSVDLSELAVVSPTGSYASLAQVAQGAEKSMVITAQRHHRSAGAWNPDPQSGMAIVDIDSLKPTYVGLQNLSNPLQLFVQGPSLLMLGSGDLSPDLGTHASMSQLSLESRQVQVSQNYDFVILEANLYSMIEPPAIIAWYKNEDQTCIQLGSKKLHCEDGGYVFNKILRVGNYLYVSYSNAGNAGLWTISIDPFEIIKKVTTNLPIQSMAFGP